MTYRARRAALWCVVVGLVACARPSTAPREARIIVPRLWDAAELADWARPVFGLGAPPTYLTPDDYYSIPVDNLRTYPVYHPSREPAGYRDGLRRRGPRPLIQPSELFSQADWIEAGRRVFVELDTPASRTADPDVLAHFSDARSIDRYRDAHHDVMTRDGVLLDYRWVIDRDGVLKVTLSSCAGCHTRLMPDGTTLAGAPSNFDLGDSPAAGRMLAQLKLDPDYTAGQDLYAQFGVPWLERDEHARLRDLPADELERFLGQDTGAVPGTMFARFNGSVLYPTRMADLRGVSLYRYLDVTGTHLHRGPADVARYGIVVEYVDKGVFGAHRMLSPAAMRVPVRPPDEAMYAMALYLESLTPAPSPFPFDARARRGQQVFEREGCGSCHSPPSYTNGKLIAASSIGTDPGLTTRTRKGTGSYRVPTLRGLWYRGAYEHSGSVASLEDWFDPRRLQPDYRPTAWRGLGVERRAVPGHEFGLDLVDADRGDLIAFLLTL
jgi:hypothetical protein